MLEDMAPKLASGQHRVALVHWSFPPTTGGVESHLVDLAHALVSAGCSVTVITGEPVPDASQDFEIVTTHLLNLDWIRNQVDGSDWYAAELRRTLGDIISHRQFDIVHGHNLHHFSSMPALVLDELRERLRFRLHHTFHETWPDMLHEKPVYRRWDGNYAVSRFVQQECRKRIGYEPRLFHLAVDPFRFDIGTPAHSSQGIPVILHPARLLPWKGVDASVRMIAALKRDGVQARLLLTDTQRIVDWSHQLESYRGEIRRLIASLGVEDRVIFRAASYMDMPALYRECDIVIYPTVADEPFGLVPLEAMSCGKPIVASRCGGIMETIVHGETGYVFPPGDESLFVHYVECLLQDPALSHRMGVAGRRHILQHFHIDVYVRKLLEYYDGAAGG